MADAFWFCTGLLLGQWLESQPWWHKTPGQLWREWRGK